MRIGIRADGGKGVGLGHLGRCMALAEAFAHFGEKPIFLDVTPECRRWVSERGFPMRRWDSFRWDILIADSYRFTPRDWKNCRLRSRTLLVIDDSGKFSGACDWILNGHIFARNLSFSAPPGATLLLGTRFFPLGRYYWEPCWDRRFPNRVRNVLVTLGGGNQAILGRILSQVRSTLPQASIHAVLSPLATRKPRPAERGLIWHENPRSLRPLLKACDLAISGGGQTLYECAFMGVPTLTMSIGINQELNIQALAEAGVVLALRGNDAGSPAFLRRLAPVLRRLDGTPALRRRLSHKGRAVVDGLGALRVASLLLWDAKARATLVPKR